MHDPRVPASGSMRSSRDPGACISISALKIPKGTCLPTGTQYTAAGDQGGTAEEVGSNSRPQAGPGD